MTSMPDQTTRGIIACVCGAIGISSAAIFMRLADVTPAASAFWRLTMAAPVLIFIYWLTARKKGRISLLPSMEEGRWILLVGLLFASELFTWHWSVAKTTVANSTLLANMATIFAALYSFVLFGERFNGRFLGGMVLALGGAALLMGRNAELNPAYIPGDMLGLLTAVLYGGYIVGAARARQVLDAPLLMAGTAMVSGILLSLPLLWVDGPIFPVSSEGWAPLIGLALIAHVLGQSLIVYGLAHVPAALGALCLLIQPVISALWAWWLFGEALGPIHMAGASAVLVGIWIARQSKRQQIMKAAG
ncbi:DMT family transporter [Kordiimonas lipolytica]|uniref:DMT family transporter n=2 Tax=Kordiimonas lipolytica TaxID=1662421 RepID=A0ABV8U7L0_9PROT